jgi:uncharacterized membrane protein YcaP (DUF421 family)
VKQVQHGEERAMSALTDAVERIFDSGQDIGLAEMALRAAIVYIAALVLIRLGGKRFLGKPTPFDAVLGIIFGSVVSRAITGNAPFLPALGAGLALVVLHGVLATLALRAHGLGALIKGRPRLLVEKGRIDGAEMLRARMSEEDLKEGIRLAAGIEDLGRVAAARLERNGQLSVVPAPAGPRLLAVELDGSVATIRISLESGLGSPP